MIFSTDIRVAVPRAVVAGSERRASRKKLTEPTISKFEHARPSACLLQEPAFSQRATPEDHN